MTFLDVMTLLGVLVFIFGIGMVYVPAALIVGGGALAGSCVALSRS